jgi:hypothetical protein
MVTNYHRTPLTITLDGRFVPSTVEYMRRRRNLVQEKDLREPLASACDVDLNSHAPTFLFSVLVKVSTYDYTNPGLCSIYD